MSVGPGTLRLAGGLGALLVCGGAGLTVAADQRPAGAPLNPPVNQGSVPVATGGLVIPPTPVCGGTAAATDPQLRDLLTQITRTPAGPARRQLLAGLTADQRQQITALLRRRQQGAACRAGAGAGATSEAPALTPSVGDAGPADQPLTFSYVS
jgi:hypothetical protein